MKTLSLLIVGLVTAAGVMFTWLANMTVLPLMLTWLPRRKRAARAHGPSLMARLFSGLVDVIESVVTRKDLWRWHSRLSWRIRRSTRL